MSNSHWDSEQSGFGENNKSSVACPSKRFMSWDFWHCVYIAEGKQALIHEPGNKLWCSKQSQKECYHLDIRVSLIILETTVNDKSVMILSWQLVCHPSLKIQIPVVLQTPEESLTWSKTVFHQTCVSAEYVLDQTLALSKKHPAHVDIFDIPESDLCQYTIKWYLLVATCSSTRFHY